MKAAKRSRKSTQAPGMAQVIFYLGPIPFFIMINVSDTLSDGLDGLVKKLGPIPFSYNDKCVGDVVGWSRRSFHKARTHYIFYNDKCLRDVVGWPRRSCHKARTHSIFLMINTFPSCHVAL